MTARRRLVMAGSGLLLAAGASGCGGSSASSGGPPGSAATSTAAGATATAPASSPAKAGPGTFSGREGAAVITAVLPAAAGQPLIAKLESYRTLEGAPPVTYVSVEVDNRSGNVNVLATGLEVVGADGSTLTLAADSDLVTQWQKLDASDTSKYNAGVDLYNSMLNETPVLPGAKTTLVFAASGGLGTPSRVFFERGLDGRTELTRTSG